MPDAAGEIAYTSAVFSRPVSFATGWMMTLAYFIVCPWEAVAVGRIAGYIVPGLDSMELYRIAGRPVYLPHLVIGLALTALLTVLNYRGIRLSATFQNWTSFGTLASLRHLRRSRSQPRLAREFPATVHAHSVDLDSAGDSDRSLFHDRIRIGGQGRRRGQPGLSQPRIFSRHLDGHLHRHSLLRQHRRGGRIRSSLAPTDRRKIHDRGGVPAGGRLALDRQIILAAALLSLFKCFNGNFVAASRLFFAMGRRGMVDSRVGAIHARHQTPSTAVLCVGLATAACMLLGDAILVPVTEVGSVACAIGWSATCAACLALARAKPGVMSLSAAERAVAWFGLAVGIAMALMKVVPLIPGHFTVYEWLALGVWIAIGRHLAAATVPQRGRAALQGSRKALNRFRALAPEGIDR